MIEFQGRRYYLDRRTGYHKTASTEPDREYLHRAIWRSEHGNIPHGWHVHHKDEDRLNNEIANLECLPMRDHVHGVHKATGIMVCEECGSRFTRESRQHRWCSAKCGWTWHNRNRVYVGNGQYIRPKTERSTDRLS